MPTLASNFIRNMSLVASANGQHIFEAAGLGMAPFRCVDYGRGSTHCDFCGTYIVRVFWIQGSGNEDTRFKVGCECVKRTGDESMSMLVERYTEEVRQENYASLRDKLLAVKATLELAHVRATLAETPHPDHVCAAQGKSALDWCTWVMRFGSQNSKLKVAEYLGCE